jgi:hypothetical protein
MAVEQYRSFQNKTRGESRFASMNMGLSNMATNLREAAEAFWQVTDEIYFAPK